jgi:hemoglobin/transferrin/lactoferrin receptor protein
LRIHALAACITLALAPAAFATAQDGADSASADSADAQPEAQPDALGTITVTATRTEREVLDTPGTVTVITRADLDREITNDIKDLVRYEPGVTVRNNTGRFGLSDFNIRGISGNRVLIEVDGARVADGFAIGNFSNANRNFVDPDLLERVEIVRGAASSLYGSNAIGGVVSFVTKDPETCLGPDERAYLSLKGGYASDDDSGFGGFTTAFGGEMLSALFAISHRSGHELDNQGDNGALDSTRTEPNPQDTEYDSLLAKLVLAPDNDHRVELAYEQNRARTLTDVISARRDTPLGSSIIRTTGLAGDDRQDRSRLALDYVIDDLGFLDTLELEAWNQSSNTSQESLEQRRTITAAGAVTPVERFRHFDFDLDADGLELRGVRSVEWGAGAHRWVGGIDYTKSDVAQRRDGFQRNLNTGAISTVVGPDAFPVRDFPISSTDETGVYLQDEIDLLDARLTLIPGLRYDRFELDPHPDEVFIADNPGVTPVGTDDDAFSPKFGAIWRFNDSWSLSGQYAHGFRAPPYNDVNLGFTNLQFGYTAIPNPDLQAETSDGIELGLRWQHEGSWAALAVFRNDYEDFIESFVSLGVDPDTGLLVFQSQNLAEVTIEGAELSGRWDLSEATSLLDGFALRGALSYARGDVDSADAPLNSIDPPRAVLGVQWAPNGDQYGAELVLTAVERKDRIDESAGALFASPGYATLDLMGWYAWNDSLRLNVGVFNLTDRTYWEWADVRGRPATDSAIDRYTRPGINAAVQLQWFF